MTSAALARLLKTLGRSAYALKAARTTPHRHRCRKGRVVPVELLPHESGVRLGWCDDCRRVFVKGMKNGR